MNNAPATAAQAPQAVPAKKNAWLDMSEADFTAYLKSAKIGSKRALEMREKRADRAGTVASIQDAAQKAVVKPAGQGTLSALQKKADVPLLPVAPAPAPGLVTRYIDPELIDIQEGWNYRFDMGAVEELAASIKDQKKHDGHGLINDIRVKEKADGRYQLIDGERRLLSVQHLISKGEVFEFGIPAKVEPADVTDRELLIKMFTANTAKPPLPIEEAYYYERLRKDGMTIAQIEKATGRSDNSIVGALALLVADEDLVEAVTKGQIGATIAKGIAVNARGDKAKQKELTAKAKAAGKDKKALKAVKKDIDDSRRAKAAKKGLTLKVRALDDNDLAQMGADVGVRLKDLLEKAGMSFDSDLREWIHADRELQIAAQFGALEALKAAAGVKTKLVF